MGIDSKKAPPLPCPTETESALSVPIEAAASEVSKTGDDTSHYSLPDDGTPVTIKTRGHKPNRSQTSLLIEYFEGGKPSSGSPSVSSDRKPSVRVRLTPSKAHGKNDHIQITETRSTRKTSQTQKATGSTSHSRSELDLADPEDTRSMNSYASATEESNVSRNPIEVEIDPSQHRRSRRKVSSPLIPATDSQASKYEPPNMSDISAIPTDSFLDGSAPTTDLLAEKRERWGPNNQDSTVEKPNRKSRLESHDRSVMQKAVEKASKPERRHKSRSRVSESGEREVDTRNSSRRRSKAGPRDSTFSATDSSMISAAPSHKSYDSHSSSKLSINNPKLLETVEDAIRRLILPELDAIKRERSQRETRETRRSKDRESLSSLTSVSREDLPVTNKRRSADTSQSTKSKDRRDREARNDLSPRSSDDHSFAPVEGNDDDPASREMLTDVALGAAVGAGLRSRSRGDEKRQRRRRRAETPRRDHSERYNDEYDDDHEVVPPMPLSSELNPSELTRTSILTAESERPHSASEEMTPVNEVPRGIASPESIHDTPTPTRTPAYSLQGIGTQHANISHGDLKALPRKGPMEYRHNDSGEFDNQYSAQVRDEYEEDYDEASHLSEPGMYDDEPGHEFYGSQDVPAPLRYVPYQQERRGLSPIQSVSGYTEGESEVHRDSRTIHSASEVSSPEKSPVRRRDLHSPSSVPSNLRSAEFGDEESSVGGSGVGYRNTTYTDDSELDHVTSGQAVRLVGENPQMVHQNFGPESAVASLVDGSILDPSLVSGSVGGYRNSQLSYDDTTREASSGAVSPAKRSANNYQENEREYTQSTARSGENEGSSSSREFTEYDLNEYGQKVPQTTNRQSPTNSETAITAAALTRAAAAALKRQTQGHESPSDEVGERQAAGEGVSRNRSFKERAKDGYRPNATPRHSIDRLSDYGHPKMGASGLPDMENPMPEIGYAYDDDHSSVQHTPSATQEQFNGAQRNEQWQRASTPTQQTHGYDRAQTPKAGQNGPHGLGLSDAAAAATIATAGALATSHSRQASQEVDDEWQRTSCDRKRDTLVTNPYEGASPIANLPGLDGNMLSAAGFGSDNYRNGFHTGSPGMGGGDEGYISAAPNEVRDGANTKGNASGGLEQPNMGNVDDPFYAPKDSRNLGAMSQGMRTPLYDPATGAGIDGIQSKDIIALMEHLMVRDAQRSARDTEILVTLVRSAADMRNSFEDIKRMLADSEDQIIGEVKDNTEKTMKRHLGGPRPFPGSAARSIQGSQAGTDDLPTKKRNLLRRALQGLSTKGTNDLGRIEDMLMQLLTDVDVLKHQNAGPSGLMSNAESISGKLAPDIPYEQDHGYEPEATPEHLLLAMLASRGIYPTTVSKRVHEIWYDRKFSDRISTVPEDENEYNSRPVSAQQAYAQQGLLSPSDDRPRGASLPLGTPPQSSPQTQQYSASNDNTPRTDEGKKKSKTSSGFFPKISRWSETTASSIGKAFRSSGGSRKHDPPEEYPQAPPSRSGSDLANYDSYQQQDVYGSEQLHSGFSQDVLPTAGDNVPNTPMIGQSQGPGTYATPEDPKYKAHRNSVNLQHPQPRNGQAQRFQAAWESTAQEYDSMSPRSADWAGSAISLNRFPQQSNQEYSENSALNSSHDADDYSWADPSSPGAQGPPRPPKEPLDNQSPTQSQTPPQHARLSQLQKEQSPQPYHSSESGYGTSNTHAGSYRSGSPRLENRNLSAALGVPTRRPSGPRAMTPSRVSEDGEERRRKRDTFGAVASPSSAISQESETF